MSGRDVWVVIGLDRNQAPLGGEPPTLGLDFENGDRPGVVDPYLGVGEHPESGQHVEALIQGFLGQPYVGLTIGGSVRYEASLDGPLEVFAHDGTISAGAIEWVRGLDLDSGGGERIGYGAVFVSCEEYVHDLPEGY